MFQITMEIELLFQGACSHFKQWRCLENPAKAENTLEETEWGPFVLLSVQTHALRMLIEK